VSSISSSSRLNVDHVLRSSFSFILRSSFSSVFRSNLSSVNQHQENEQESLYVEKARRLKKNRVRREKKNRVRREKNDRIRQLQKNHSTTQNEFLKRRNLLKIEIARRTTLLHDLKTKKKEREQKRKKEKRLRQSSVEFFEFFQCSHSSAIDLTMLLMNEKSFIDLSKKSRMTDVFIRSSKNAFINTTSSFQDVDVDSFIN
jgi:hypothetical protein